MELQVSGSLKGALAVSMIAYVIVMFGLSAWASGRVKGVEDYVVAGRRLPLWMATGTLLATWFGAGTLLTAADEVRARGVSAATLDPLGAGLCLILVGVFFAKPLWRAKLTTLPELFGRRFGPGARRASAALMIPPYLGWIAAQFMALAGMLELFFGVPQGLGVALVCAVGLGYTLLGGMWAVTLTDAAQVALLIVGLLVMAWVVLSELGQGQVGLGAATLWAQTPPARRALIPDASAAKALGFMGVLCAGALGNVPSQDVMQRVFSSRSARVAAGACLGAGALYLTLGAIPVLLGLAAATLAPEQQQASVLPWLAAQMLHPAMAVVLVLTLMSAVLSTIDSAILAPATVLSHDLLRAHPRLASIDALRLNRAAVAVIGLVSLALAWAGQSAYSLLESGYELGMVSLMAPLVFAVYGRRAWAWGAWGSMGAGTAAWALHKALGVEVFLGWQGLALGPGLGCAALSLLGYPVGAALERRLGRPRHAEGLASDAGQDEDEDEDEDGPHQPAPSSAR